MKRICLLIVSVLLLFSNLKSFGQNISNEGTDFWAVFPTHVPNSKDNLGQITIFVTSKYNTEVTVSCGVYTETKAIPANTKVAFEVYRESAHVYLEERNKVLPNRGIHIKVTDGKEKVSAYAHIWGKARSAASLILPYETLGQTYYSMNYEQNSGGNNYLALVGVDDNTNVIIHGRDTTIPVTLNKGEVYEYVPSGTEDLTGVYVEVDKTTSACKRFAAFSGSSFISIGCSGSYDPLFQQLYPTTSWGKNYGVVPFINRRYDVRIIAQEDSTTVTYGNYTQVVNKGQYISTGFVSEPLFISADKLISVAQYSLTQACSAAAGGSATGDPDMVVLNPIEFSIKNITIFSSDQEKITERYLNVLMRTDKTSSFKINGTVPNAVWKPLAPNSIYSYAQITITNLPFSLTLTADDGFNVIGYGFGSAESYAYSAGTNLSSNNYLTVVNKSNNEEGPNGCIDQYLDFKINLPYQADRITWKLDDENPIVENVLPETKTVNGQVLYVYKYPANKVYTKIGEYHLEITAHVPQNASNCTSGDLITNYIFNIYNLPVAKFDAVPTGCANSEIPFVDKSELIDANSRITTWLWDFGDGSTASAEQNPKHKFVKEGDYQVKLSVKTDAGCFSDPIASHSIRIFPQPISKFASVSKSCVNTDILFTDQSTISTAFIPTSAIKSWKWNFGDGTELVKLDNASLVHQYANPGKYTVTLITTSESGCLSEPFTFNVEVTPLPKANFTMPDICLTDGTAKFINTSVNADGTGNNIIKYEWNFDKDNPVTAGNLSSSKDGVHLYTAAKVYHVELKITNENGCTSVVNKEFVVNGAVPKANFDILSQNTFCSNQPLVIRNKSSVDFGKIVKLRVYSDYDSNPTDFKEFISTIPDLIPLDYEPFNLPLTKQVKIRMEAFSGNVCFDVMEQMAILKSSPIIVFDDMPAVCENDGAVVIGEAKERNGFAGTGIYTSKDQGLEENGTFNPKIAGPGFHNITYTFTSSNGCSSSVSKTIEVKKSPYADAGGTLYMLAGGEITIPASAEGSGLVYSWYPASGLNKTDILNPVASPEHTTDYTLTVTTDRDCSTSAKVKVVVLEALNPPNSFTPNGDGVNDYWDIKYLNTYPKATVEIFNRNGNRIYFSSNGYKVPFDGNYMNQPLPVGVYYYKIDPGNGRKTITGPLTIIR